MKLILHIGTPKTGTTSIQKALYDEQEALSSQGIYLLERLGRPNNNLFSGAFEDYPNQYSRAGGHSRDSWEALVAQRLQTFLEEVDAAANNHHTVLVTSEQMSRRFGSQNITRLAGTLIPKFSEISVVCSVRDQVCALPSLYWLSIRTGAETTSLRRWVMERGLFQTHLYYDQLANKWGTAFGGQNLKFLVFQETKDWDAVTSFFSSVIPSFVPISGPQLAQRRNRSGSAAQSILLRLANYSYGLRNKRNPKSWRELSSRKRQILKISTFLGGFRRGILSGELAEVVARHFLESNQRFANAHLGSEWPFPAQVMWLKNFSTPS